jgi:hypothetical protein
MNEFGDGHWVTLHAKRPRWYACVWRACAACESWVTEHEAASLIASSLPYDEEESQLTDIQRRVYLYTLARQQLTGMGTRAMLLLALEEPTLADMTPVSFDATRQTMCAVYVLRELFVHALADELARYWADRKGGMQFASMPQKTPQVDEALPFPTLLTQGAAEQVVKRTDEAFTTWQSTFLADQGSLPTWEEAQRKVYEYMEMALSEVQSTAGSLTQSENVCVSVPSGHLTLLKRLERVTQVYEEGLNTLLQHVGEPPDEALAMDMAKECADVATYGECDTYSLLLLALEVPWFAEVEPDNYEVLQADHHDGHIALSAAYLISEHVYLSVLATLEGRMDLWYRTCWAGRADGCEICGRERGDALWSPFAGLPFLFVPCAEQSLQAHTGTRLVLRIGEECRHTLEYGGTVSFAWDENLYCANQARGIFPYGEAFA